MHPDQNLQITQTVLWHTSLTKAPFCRVVEKVWHLLLMKIAVLSRKCHWKNSSQRLLSLWCGQGLFATVKSIVVLKVWDQTGFVHTCLDLFKWNLVQFTWISENAPYKPQCAPNMCSGAPSDVRARPSELCAFVNSGNWCQKHHTTLIFPKSGKKKESKYCSSTKQHEQESKHRAILTGKMRYEHLGWRGHFGSIRNSSQKRSRIQNNQCLRKFKL